MKCLWKYLGKELKEDWFYDISMPEELTKAGHTVVIFDGTVSLSYTARSLNPTKRTTFDGTLQGKSYSIWDNIVRVKMFFLN